MFLTVATESLYMSQSQQEPPGEHSIDSSDGHYHRITDEERITDLLGAFNDQACRDILDATSDSVLSAKELSDECDLPLSSTYRKLELLTEVGLLEERTRIRLSGKHTSEYCRKVGDVVLSITPGGTVELDVSLHDHAKQGGAESVVND